MKDFNEFLKEGIVRKHSPNAQRALSLFKEANEKKEFLEFTLKNTPTERMLPNFIIEYCYDIMLETLRARMLLNGFSSGNSHEAEVAYSISIGFTKQEAQFLDQIRYNRNGIKYYGKILDKEYAGNVLKFFKKVYPLLKKEK